MFSPDLLFMDLLPSEELAVKDTPESGLHCAFCGSSDQLKACGNCTRVYYCCKQHQIEDWKSHKTLCKSISSTSNGRLTKKMAELSVQQTDESDSQDHSQRTRAGKQKILIWNKVLSKIIVFCVSVYHTGLFRYVLCNVLLIFACF